MPQAHTFLVFQYRISEAKPKTAVSNILPIANISHIFDGCLSLKEVNCSNSLIKNEYLRHLNLLNSNNGN